MCSSSQGLTALAISLSERESCRHEHSRWRRRSERRAPPSRVRSSSHCTRTRRLALHAHSPDAGDPNRVPFDDSLLTAMTYVTAQVTPRLHLHTVASSTSAAGNQAYSVPYETNTILWFLLRNNYEGVPLVDFLTAAVWRRLQHWPGISRFQFACHWTISPKWAIQLADFLVPGLSHRSA